MTRPPFASLGLTLLAGLGACAAKTDTPPSVPAQSVSAQSAPTEPTTTGPDGPTDMVIAGGYTSSSPVDEANTSETAARDLAVAELYKRFPTRARVESTQVATQVVAGLNYRFTIGLSGGATYEAVVYRDLEDHMSVTSLGPVK